MDQLPRLGKRELICLLLFTCNYVVFVWRGFLFLWVLGIGNVILLWHSLSLPYNYLLPTVRIRSLYLFSASSVNLHGACNTNVLHNNLRVRLSPIKSPVLREYLNPFKRPSMYPSISKCNAKSCNCCQHLCTNTLLLYL